MKLIQSYVLDQYFVSTIQRQFDNPQKLEYETMWWEWNSYKKERGELLGQKTTYNHKSAALATHASVCDDLIVSFAKENNG